MKHRLLKKKLSDNDIGTEIGEVSFYLEKWITENFIHEINRAFYGQGKYRLGPGYQQFFREPTLFLKWSKERQSQHLDSFLNFTAKAYSSYVKPSNAGQKGNTKAGQKRRCNLPEPQFFSERSSFAIDTEVTSSNHKISPVKISKISSTNWKVKSPEITTNDIFNSDRRPTKQSFPTTVQRCQECRISFMPQDFVGVKTTSDREYTDKNGQKKKSFGNVYLHYITTCLKEFDQNFNFNSINVPKGTQNHLKPSEIHKLKTKGCNIE